MAISPEILEEISIEDSESRNGGSSDVSNRGSNIGSC